MERDGRRARAIEIAREHYEAQTNTEIDDSEFAGWLIAAITHALEEAGTRPPIEMGLCEIQHLVLHSDQPYIFRKMPGCERCSEYAAPTDSKEPPTCAHELQTREMHGQQWTTCTRCGGLFVGAGTNQERGEGAEDAALIADLQTKRACFATVAARDGGMEINNTDVSLMATLFGRIIDRIATLSALLAKNEGRVKEIVDEQLLARVEKAEAAAEADRRDAGRYRYLSAQSVAWADQGDDAWRRGSSLDSKVDAAIAATKVEES